MDEATRHALHATAGVVPVLSVAWMVCGVGVLVLGAFIALTAKRKSRRIAGVCLFAASVFLILAHPAPNLLLFGHIAEQRLIGEFDRAQSMHLAGCTPAQVEASLGSPDRTETANGRTNWHYSPGPWYAYQLDDIVVTFESGVVSSVWIDYF